MSALQRADVFIRLFVSVHDHLKRFHFCFQPIFMKTWRILQGQLLSEEPVKFWDWCYCYWVAIWQPFCIFDITTPCFKKPDPWNFLL